jgi:O-antigen/teichoic acid export membrane protein
MTVGFLSVALSSAILLAVAARVLTPGAFGGLGWAWTFSTVFGFGIATPTEQAINQRLNRGVGAGLGRASTSVLAIATGLAVLVAIGARGIDVAERFGPLLLSCLTAVAGWLVACWVRGHIGGAGDMAAYGVLLGLEAGIRLVLVGAALTLEPAPLLLGLAIGLPTLLSALAGLLLTRRAFPRGAGPSPGRVSAEGTWFLMALVVVAVGYQACLNGPPLVLGWRSSEFTASELGAFVVANTWFRTPTILIGGLSIHALTELSRAWGPHGSPHLMEVAKPLFLRAGLVALAATVACAVSSPLAFRLLLGGSTGVPAALLAALGVSTVLAVGAVMTGTALIAADDGRSAALAWATGGASTVLGVLASDGQSELLGPALVLGPAISLALGALLLHRRLSSNARIHPDRLR